MKKNNISKILLTFGAELRNLIIILITLVLFFSCTKEKDIPFQDSIKDTINVVFYNNISGTYSGLIKNIEFVSPNSYLELSKAKHTITISEIDFKNVLIENISNNINSNAEAALFRVNKSRGYLRFIPHTMIDSTGIDTVFQGAYNGIYFYGSGKLEYFFYYIKQKDTTHQVFTGNLK